MKLTRGKLALGPYLAEFRVSAFRLECRQHYDIPAEREWFERYLRTGETPVLTPEKDRWCRLVAEARAEGRLVQRVHLIREPLSDYVRFELECQRASVDAGEDVRVVVMPDGPEHLPFAPEGHLEDFWLFDDATVVTLDYDPDGRFLGAREGRRALKYYRQLRDQVMQHSTPLEEYSYP